MRPASSWSIADLIDFEVLLGESPGEGDARWRETLPAELAVMHAGMDASGRRRVFKAWLEAQRESRPGALPGEAIAAGWRMLGVLGAFVGVAVGGGVTAGLLHYRGEEPVNVAWFLACTLGIQWAALGAVAGIACLRAITPLFRGFYPVRRFLTALVWVCREGVFRLPGERREAFRAGLGVLERKRELYGSLAVWPFLIVTQLIAVAFNVGILGTLLIHVTATDLGFGWQSTLELSADAVHRMVSVVSLPWAWLVAGAHPSLEQIVGSRFSYSEGMAPLDRAALASWWVFLVGAVTVYGLLARLILLGVAVLGLRRGLRGLTFDHEGCNALLRRLAGPLVRGQEGTAVLEVPGSAGVAGAHSGHGGACFAMVASDLGLPASLVGDQLRSALGWTPARVESVRIDHPSGNREVLAALASHGDRGKRVVVVVGARRSPIRAIALFLTKVVEAAGPGADVVLLLAGHGHGADAAPVADADWQHWRNFLAIHRLHLSLEKWGGA